jgi:hypothetical protein
MSTSNNNTISNNNTGWRLKFQKELTSERISGNAYWTSMIIWNKHLLNELNIALKSGKASLYMEKIYSAPCLFASGQLTSFHVLQLHVIWRAKGLTFTSHLIYLFMSWSYTRRYLYHWLGLGLSAICFQLRKNNILWIK